MNRWMSNCPRCRSPLLEEPSGSGILPCKRCGFELEYLLLPAARSACRPPPVPRLVVEGEATCFNHPANRAEQECGRCGRFLCALCAVEFGDKFLCPECLRTGRDEVAVGGQYLPKSRFLPGEFALFITVLSIILGPVALATAPLSIGLGIRSLFKPGSLIAPRRLAGILAIVVGSLQLAGWSFFVVTMFLKD